MWQVCKWLRLAVWAIALTETCALAQSSESPQASSPGAGAAAPTAGALEVADGLRLDMPLAYAQEMQVDADSSGTITLCGSSLAGRRLTFQIVSGPEHGTLGPISSNAANIGVVTYTPALGFAGPDTFRFRAGYGVLWSPAAFVSLTVVAAEPGPGPDAAPDVRFDAQRRMRVDGNPVFPIGFWGLYYSPPVIATPDWADYAASFSSLTDGLTSSAVLAALAGYDIYLQAQGGLTYHAPQSSGRAGRAFDANAILAARGRRNIIAWETFHEPDYYGWDDPRGNVAGQASLIRSADPYHRPVLVTPSAGAGDYFGQCAPYTDYTAVQYYPTPCLALKSIADHIEDVKDQWRGEQGAVEPFVYVYRVQGHQSMRYRLFEREPTLDEVRAAGYLAGVHGASGLSWSSYSKGPGSGNLKPFELWDGIYRVTDSPAFYATLKRIGVDLRYASRLFLSPPTDITATCDDPDVHCAVYDVNGELPGGSYLLCVNVADQSAPKMEYVSSDTVERIRAYGQCTTGEYAPQTECNDGIDNDGDGMTDGASECFGVEDEREGSPPLTLAQISMHPAKIYWNHLQTGVRSTPLNLDRVYVYFRSGAPAGSKFQFAIYSDTNRDLSPGTRVYSDQVWYNVPATPGYAQCTLAPSLQLENTREYFLGVRVNKVGIPSETQDVRTGCRVIPGIDIFEGADPASVPFPTGFPPLHTGRAVTATVTLRGAMFEEYCATRGVCDLCCWPGPVINNQITDDFLAYSVHLYQLLP